MWESVIFGHLAEWHFILYVLIFASMVVEGGTVLLAAVFLAQTGQLNLWIVLLSSFSGMVIGDSLWYWLGPVLDRYLFTKRLVKGFMPVIDNHIKKRPMASIFVAKFVYFLHRIVLVRIKPNGVSFRKFFEADLIAILGWIIVSTTLGIVFASSLSLLKTTIKYAEIGMLVAVIVLMTGEHIISKLYRKRLEREEQELEQEMR